MNDNVNTTILKERAFKLLEEGKLLLKEQKEEESIDKFGHALEAIVESCNELDPQTVDFYYHYADALIINHEKNLDVLGTILKPSEEDNPESSNEDNDDDMELAWQLLDTCRVIYSTHPPSNPVHYAQVYQRLGDISMESGNFSQALTDYQSAYDILSTDDNCRMICSVMVSLACCYLYLHQYSHSLEYYEKAINVLQNRISQCISDIKTLYPHLTSSLPSHFDELSSIDDLLKKENLNENVQVLLKEISENFSFIKELSSKKEELDFLENEEKESIALSNSTSSIESSQPKNIISIKRKKNEDYLDDTSNSMIKAQKIE